MQNNFVRINFGTTIILQMLISLPTNTIANGYALRFTEVKIIKLLLASIDWLHILVVECHEYRIDVVDSLAKQQSI